MVFCVLSNMTYFSAAAELFVVAFAKASFMCISKCYHLFMYCTHCMKQSYCFCALCNLLFIALVGSWNVVSVEMSVVWLLTVSLKCQPTTLLRAASGTLMPCFNLSSIPRVTHTTLSLSLVRIHWLVIILCVRWFKTIEFQVFRAHKITSIY